jgi:hypothetical protein
MPACATVVPRRMPNPVAAQSSSSGIRILTEARPSLSYNRANELEQRRDGGWRRSDALHESRRGWSAGGELGKLRRLSRSSRLTLLLTTAGRWVGPRETKAAAVGEDRAVNGGVAVNGIAECETIGQSNA